MHEILHIDKFEGADFKYDYNFLKNLAQKYRYQAFLVTKLGIFIISQYLQLDKFKGSELKYDNSFLKNL